MTAPDTPTGHLVPLADRIRHATGIDPDQPSPTGRHGDGAVDDVLAAYRLLARAEQAVTFHRDALGHLASGRYTVDNACLSRLRRTVQALQESAADRDRCRENLLQILQPLEAAADRHRQATDDPVPAADLPALLSIAHSGAMLRENLISHRVHLVTSSGRRIAWPAYQRLENAGLVTRDTSHPLHAGQPVALTPAGRLALTERLADPAHSPAPAVRRPGAFPRPAPRRG
ncbi:hypothetical protein OK074_5031 [Actinobacteria bacterium OK074]|nr:hypothetical protein OK074_5031 [Actinobacteria bacterium OK074]